MVKCVMVMGVCWVVYLVLRFVRYYECIVGATMVCDKPLMQWYIVVQRAAEPGGVKSDA